MCTHNYNECWEGQKQLESKINNSFDKVASKLEYFQNPKTSELAALLSELHNLQDEMNKLKIFPQNVSSANSDIADLRTGLCVLKEELQNLKTPQTSILHTQFPLSKSATITRPMV